MSDIHIIGRRYSPEQIFSMSMRAVKEGVAALASTARCSEHHARAFLAVAAVKHILKASGADATKNFLGALGAVVDATKDADNVQLTAAVMEDLNRAVMKLGQGR